MVSGEMFLSEGAEGFEAFVVYTHFAEAALARPLCCKGANNTADIRADAADIGVPPLSLETVCAHFSFQSTIKRSSSASLLFCTHAVTWD